jgi:hypothetical protein
MRVGHPDPRESKILFTELLCDMLVMEGAELANLAGRAPNHAEETAQKPRSLAHLGIKQCSDTLCCTVCTSPHLPHLVNSTNLKISVLVEREKGMGMGGWGGLCTDAGV